MAIWTATVCTRPTTVSSRTWFERQQGHPIFLQAGRILGATSLGVINSTAKGGGRSLKTRAPQGEVGCYVRHCFFSIPTGIQAKADLAAYLGAEKPPVRGVAAELHRLSQSRQRSCGPRLASGLNKWQRLCGRLLSLQRQVPTIAVYFDSISTSNYLLVFSMLF